MCAVTVLAVSLAAAAPAGAGDPPLSAERRAELEQRFQRMDRNGDGLIAANEAPRIVRARCGSSAGEDRPSGWLETFDADGSRHVDLREFIAGSATNEVGPRQVAALAD